MNRASLAAFLLLFPLSAGAGVSDGGGGGAYVCRDSSGQVTSARLVDLWESENTPFDWGNSSLLLKIPHDVQTTESLQLDRAIARLTQLDSGLARTVKRELLRIQGSVHPLPPGISLTLPVDLQTDFFPTGCPPEGMLRYSDVSQALYVKPEIFDKLASTADVAASYMHEAVYKVFREGVDGAPNSILVRRLVAWLFSEDSISMIQETPPVDLPLFTCQLIGESVNRTDPRVDAVIYPTGGESVHESYKVYDSWRMAFSRLGNMRFGAPVFFDINDSTVDKKNVFGEVSFKASGWFERFGYHPLQGHTQDFRTELNYDGTHGAGNEAKPGYQTIVHLDELASRLPGGASLSGGSVSMICTKVR